jgi:multidrug efflux pump subunit AcrB
MWIVRLALNRPYTFIVLALLILIMGTVTILSTPTDIFPNINIPVVAVAWTYTGLNPEDIETRLTTPYEKILTTLVDNIEHLESTSYNGEAIVKIFLQPGASLDTANAQVVAAGGLFSAFCRRAFSPRRSSTSALPVCRFCNWVFPERACPSNS